MNLNSLNSNLRIEFPSHYTERQVYLDVYKRFYENTLYDQLADYSREYDSTNKYVKLSMRKPAVLYGLPEIIVDRSVSMLFADSHFPELKCEDESVQEFIEDFIRIYPIRNKMILAAKTGSIGSVGILVKVCYSKIVLEIVEAQNVEPIFDQDDPDRLVAVKEVYQMSGRELKKLGYKIDNVNLQYFWGRIIDEVQESAFIPWSLTDNVNPEFTPSIDKKRTILHGAGCIPFVWIKNLPCINGVDGKCTFSSIIDIVMEINCHLSQQGRSLKYNSDPTLVVKDSSDYQDFDIMKVKTSGVLEVDSEGGAELLEMDGKSTENVLKFVDKLREFAMEVVRGDRSTPEKMNMAHSGKALEVMNFPFVSLVDELRLSYGQGLLEIYKIILRFCASGMYDIKNSQKVAHVDVDNTELYLSWPEWYPLTEHDKLLKAQTLKTLTDSRNLSHDSAVESIAKIFSIEDIDEEIKKIDKDALELYNEGAKITEVVNV